MLAEVLAGRTGPFALLHREGRPDHVDVVVGPALTVETLADIPLPEATPATDGERHEALVLVPYRQVAERGFVCVDDGTPLTVIRVEREARVPVPTVVARLPEVPISVVGGGFDVDDDGYARIVRDVVRDEIGSGEGANFVIRRSFVTDISEYTPRVALTFFRRLLERESSTYWTFLVHTGDRTLIGASPERHVSLRDGIVVMNPISGTYCYPPSGPRLDELIHFLADEKETDELYMVVDEELKMMARICDEGGRVHGPYLKQMAKVAHTEYLIEGRTSYDVREILRETMFAPTVTGSPLENACRVIARHEPTGRAYYSGVAALIGRDATGDRTLDSTILIRTADIAPDGRLRIAVGSTLVRHSDPQAEVAETRGKAAALLAALGSAAPGRLADHPRVQAALARRNEPIAQFWLRPVGDSGEHTPDLAGRRVLVIDAEDTFTAMIAALLRSMGLTVTTRRYDEEHRYEDHDLVVMGPGPGDPTNEQDPRVNWLTVSMRRLLGTGQPFLAVCLSHQVLSRLLGLRVTRRPAPNQGVQQEIDLFGRPARLGFYNSFAAFSTVDEHPYGSGESVTVSRDRSTGEVHALRGPHFWSVQFHAESVLSRDGAAVIRDALRELLARHPAVAR
ncbi:phenazine-specific anthranilate synthase component I [Micromonospora sp. KC723]|nr:phenazine-specific anthranilate synthase component I [Micromonospora sp. KC723]